MTLKLVLHLYSRLVGMVREAAKPFNTATVSFQDLVANGALVSICNKYGEMPVDKAKAPLRELLRGLSPNLFVFSRPYLSSHSILQLGPKLFFFPRAGREDGPEPEPYSIQGHILEGNHPYSAP